jgi:hypothetical protein
MTASDLSDQTKPWDSTKHIAVSCFTEYQALLYIVVKLINLNAS